MIKKYNYWHLAWISIFDNLYLYYQCDTQTTLFYWKLEFLSICTAIWDAFHNWKLKTENYRLLHRTFMKKYQLLNSQYDSNSKCNGMECPLSQARHDFHDFPCQVLDTTLSGHLWRNISWSIGETEGWLSENRVRVHSGCMFINTNYINYT